MFANNTTHSIVGIGNLIDKNVRKTVSAPHKEMLRHRRHPHNRPQCAPEDQGQKCNEQRSTRIAGGSGLHRICVDRSWRS